MPHVFVIVWRACSMTLDALNTSRVSLQVHIKTHGLHCQAARSFEVDVAPGLAVHLPCSHD